VDVGHTSGTPAALLALSKAGFHRVPRGERGMDAGIDALAYGLYAWSEEEIAIVEGRDQ
jgi:hypothetical protein